MPAYPRYACRISNGGSAGGKGLVEIRESSESRGVQPYLYNGTSIGIQPPGTDCRSFPLGKSFIVIGIDMTDWNEEVRK